MFYLLLIGTLLICVGVVVFLLVVQILFLRNNDPYAPEAIEARKKVRKATQSSLKRGETSSASADPLAEVSPPGTTGSHRSNLGAEHMLSPGLPSGPLYGNLIASTHPSQKLKPSTGVDIPVPLMPFGEPLYAQSGQRRFSGNPASLAGVPPLVTRRPGMKTDDLLREYTEGMRISFDEQLGAMLFVTTNLVMNTPTEVDLAFLVCNRQMHGVLKSRRLQKAALLTDIAGLNIGREATTAWGQAFKNCLDDICIKVGQDVYLVAHYNSTISQPSQEQMREKIRRIQIMTSATANNFQSNIFDTREEAGAFLVRMREFYHI